MVPRKREEYQRREAERGGFNVYPPPHMTCQEAERGGHLAGVERGGESFYDYDISNPKRSTGTGWCGG